MSARLLESDGRGARAVATNGIGRRTRGVLASTHFVHRVPTPIIEHCHVRNNGSFKKNKKNKLDVIDKHSPMQDMILN